MNEYFDNNLIPCNRENFLNEKFSDKNKTLLEQFKYNKISEYNKFILNFFNKFSLSFSMIYTKNFFENLFNKNNIEIKNLEFIDTLFNNFWINDINRNQIYVCLNDPYFDISKIIKTKNNELVLNFYEKHFTIIDKVLTIIGDLNCSYKVKVLFPNHVFDINYISENNDYIRIINSTLNYTTYDVKQENIVKHEKTFNHELKLNVKQNLPIHLNELKNTLKVKQFEFEYKNDKQKNQHRLKPMFEKYKNYPDIKIRKNIMTYCFNCIHYDFCKSDKPLFDT